jgi:hypothetical protein
MRRLTFALGIVLISSMAGVAQTPAVTTPSPPDRFYNTFSGAHPPAIRIKPGDRVITKTIDASGTDWNGKSVAQGPNPQTGPFFIEGAEPGDMIAWTFTKMELNRATAYSGGALRALHRHAGIDPQSHRAAGAARQLDPRQGVGDGAARQRRHQRVAAAHAADAWLADGQWRRHARSDRDQHAGRVWRQHGLRRHEPGREGDASRSTSRARCSSSATATRFRAKARSSAPVSRRRWTWKFSVQLVKKSPIKWPRLENETHVMVLGSERSLIEALQQADERNASWLMQDYGLSERGRFPADGTGARIRSGERRRSRASPWSRRCGSRCWPGLKR